IEFGIKTTSILLDEYDNAKKANVPDFILAKHIEDYVDKQYGGDNILRKKTAFINESDIVALKSDADKQSLLLTGSVTQRDLQYSVRLSKIIDRLIREKGEDWFLESNFDTIEVSVMDAFDAIIPNPQAIPPDPSLYNE